MNNWTGIGRITKDLILRGTEEKPFLYVTLAVKRKFGSETDFIDCIAFGKTANNIYNHCQKGHSLGVTGRLQVESKKVNGEWKNNTNIVIEDITFIQPKVSETKQEEKTLKEFFQKEEEIQILDLDAEKMGQTLENLQNEGQYEKKEETSSSFAFKEKFGEDDMNTPDDPQLFKVEEVEIGELDPFQLNDDEFDKIIKGV